MYQRRRAASAVLALSLAAGALGFSPPGASAAPTAKVSIRAADAVVGEDRAVRITVNCAHAACVGTVKAKIKGVGTLSKKYRLAKGRAGLVTLRASPAQMKKLAAASRTTTLTLTRSVGGRTKQRITRSIRLRAAAPALSLAASEVVVGHDHVATLSLRSNARTAVNAKVSLSVATVPGGGTQVVSVPGRGTRTLTFALSDAQVARLSAKAAVSGQVRIVETKPEKVTRTRPISLRLDHDMGGGAGDGHDGHDTSPVPTGQSSAYARGWNPTVHDTCTRIEHESYAVTGVDGKLYPGWHPPVHTRSDGSTCTFGHEHGDDPRNSDIYDWVIGQYQSENKAADGVPFGYGSEQLTEHANATGINIHRHEDDPGHKVIVANDQVMGVEFTDRWGERSPLVCDTLIKAHQGSHSSDATKNNTHELVYAIQCNDGAKVLTTVMTNYGNSNELLASCTRPFIAEHGEARPVATLGSILPDGDGGARLIPTAECIDRFVKQGTENGQAGSAIDDRRGSPASSSNGWWWAGYEQWQSFTSLRTADGKEIARFEPWLGLQNPSRYYTGNGATDTTVAYLNDLAWQDGAHQQWSPWKEQAAASATPIDRKSPQAWFNGAIRDAWLTTTKVDNREAPETVIYTDPWGKNGSSERTVGSIRTYVSRTSNTDYVTTTTPSVINRSVRTAEALTRKGSSAPLTMNFFYDYGRDAQGRSLGVHAPN